MSAGTTRPEPLLDASGVAERLSVPATWVRERTRAGLIPFVPLGRYIRYRPEETDRLIVEGLETANPGGRHRLRAVQP